MNTTHVFQLFSMYYENNINKLYQLLLFKKLVKKLIENIKNIIKKKKFLKLQLYCYKTYFYTMPSKCYYNIKLFLNIKSIEM